MNSGLSGYVSKDVIKQHVAPPTLNDKVKVFVCGPPPQVAALAGKKDGMKQGELAGALKELGYTEGQASRNYRHLIGLLISTHQVFKF